MIESFVIIGAAVGVVVLSLVLMVLIIRTLRERQRLREVIEQARRAATLDAERKRRDLLRRELRAAMQIGKSANGVPGQEPKP